MGASTVKRSSSLQMTKQVRHALITGKALHRLWYGRGKVLTRQGYFEAALASFDAALRLQPRNPQSWIYRGVVLMHMQRYEGALVSFNRALEIAPKSREAWLFQGAVFRYLNCHHEALLSYNAALQLQDDRTKEDYPLWTPAMIETGLSSHA